MTDNELKFWTVVFAFAFAMWVLHFMRRLGFFNSQNVYDRAKFVWDIYKQAQTLDQKIVALVIGFFVLTYTLTLSFFGFVLAFLGLVVGAVFNYQPLQFLIDLLKMILAFFSQPQVQARPI